MVLEFMACAFRLLLRDPQMTLVAVDLDSMGDLPQSMHLGGLVDIVLIIMAERR